MTFSDLFGAESGKCLVCGCGVSLSRIIGRDTPDLIGVNDSCAAVPLKYHVVINLKSTFSATRWNDIRRTGAKAVFTHIPGLEIDDPSKICHIPLGKYGGTDVSGPKVDFTSTSAYVACVIAHKLGYREIGMIGVDFTEDHFNAKTGTHKLNSRLPSIDAEFLALSRAIAHAGGTLVNLSDVSSLRSIDRVPLEEFLR